MNWSTGIVIFFLAFLVHILSLTTTPAFQVTTKYVETGISKDYIGIFMITTTGICGNSSALAL